MLGSIVEFDPAPSASARQILSPSVKRHSLTFFAPTTGRVTLSQNSSVQDGQGIVLQATMARIELTIHIHGEVVQQGWFAVYSPGATGVAWIEGIG